MTDPQTPNQPPSGDSAAAQPPAYEPAAVPPPAHEPQPAPTPPAYEPPAAYGAPAYQAPAYAAAPAYQPGPAAGGAVPGKTLGIVAFVLSFVLSAAALIPLVLGIVALVQSKRAGQKNGFALAAIIISSIAIVLGLILLFALVIPSLQAGFTCATDPNAVVSLWGVEVSCQEVLEQSR